MTNHRPEQEANLEAMRNRWRRFAQEAPMFYIASQQAEWTQKDFLAAGNDMVEPILKHLGDRIERRSALEIGCGLGRILYNLAPEFEQVHGIDIAPEMIEHAEAMGHLPDNVELHVGTGSDLAPIDDAGIDLVLSLLVFQHIPDRNVIAAYVRDIARVLRPGGIAWLQFDTRPRNPAVAVLQALPDPLLPRSRRRHIRRYRIAASEPARMAAEAGLVVAEELEPGTDQHVAVLTLPPARR